MTIDDNQRSKLVPSSGVALSTSSSSGNCRPSETDSGVAAISVQPITNGTHANGNNRHDGASNGFVTAESSVNSSKQTSPQSQQRDMDINNLPDVIIKYAKPSDLELIQKLQVSSAARGARNNKGLSVNRGHQRNVSDFGIIADYHEGFAPLYPSDLPGLRPFIEPFDFRAPMPGREPVVRVAFWDIENCGMEKISNPGVLETICMTILEGGFSIIGFTDILDTGVIDRVADQLTWPSLQSVRGWRGPRGTWKSTYVKIGNRVDSEELSTSRTGLPSNCDQDSIGKPIYCAFVYDTSRMIKLAAVDETSPSCTPEKNGTGVKSGAPVCLDVELPDTTLHTLSFKPAAVKFSVSV